MILKMINNLNELVPQYFLYKASQYYNNIRNQNKTYFLQNILTFLQQVCLLNLKCTSQNQHYNKFTTTKPCTQQAIATLIFPPMNQLSLNNMDKLQQDLKSANQKIKSVQQYADSMTKIQQNTYTQLLEQRHINTALQNKIQTLINQLSQEKNILAFLQKQIQSRQRSQKQKLQEFQKVQKINSDLQINLQNHTCEILKQNSEIEKYKQENQELKNVRKCFEERNKVIIESLEQMEKAKESEISKQKAEIQKYKRQNLDLENVRKCIEEEKKMIIESLKTKEREIIQQMTEIKKYKQENLDLENVKKCIEKENKMIIESLEQMEKAKESEISKQKAEIEKYKKANLDLENVSRFIEEENEMIIKSLKQMEKTKESEILKQKTQIEKYKKANLGLENIIKCIEEQNKTIIESLKQQKASISIRLTDQTEKNQVLNLQTISLRQQLSKSEKNNKELQKEIENLKYELKSRSENLFKNNSQNDVRKAFRFRSLKEDDDDMNRSSRSISRARKQACLQKAHNWTQQFTSEQKKIILNELQPKIKLCTQELQSHFKKQKDQLIAKHARYTQKIAKEHKQITQKLNRTISQQQKKIKQAIDEVKIIKIQNQLSMQQLYKDIHKLNYQKDTLTHNILNLEKNIKSNNQQADKLLLIEKASNNQLKNQIQKLNAKIEKIIQNLIHCQMEISQLTLKEKQMQSHMVKLQQQKVVKEKLIESNKAQITNWKQQISLLLKNIHQLQRQLHENKQSLNNSIESSQQKQNFIFQYQKQITLLTNQLNQKSLEYQQLSKAVSLKNHASKVQVQVQTHRSYIVEANVQAQIQTDKQPQAQAYVQVEIQNDSQHQLLIEDLLQKNLNLTLQIQTQRNNFQTINQQLQQTIALKQSNYLQKITQITQGKQQLQLQLQHTIQNKQSQAIFSIRGILQTHNHKKQLLINAIQQRAGLKTIKSTKLIYSYDSLNNTSFHNYIDDKQNFFIIFHTQNDKIFGAFSTSMFKQHFKEPQQTKAFLFSFNSDLREPMTCFELKKGKQNARSLVWDEFYLIVGNSDIRWRKGENKIISNFGLPHGYYDPNGCKVWDLLQEGDSREVQIRGFECYQVEFNQ